MSKEVSEVADGHSGSVQPKFSSLLNDFDKLESLFKTVGLMNLGLDANVLNEYRYFARALVDMLRWESDAQRATDYEAARGRAETAYSSALCDTVDNLHMHVSGSIRRVKDLYPLFDLNTFLGEEVSAKAFASLKWLEDEISRSREDRAARKGIYQKIAKSRKLKDVIELAKDLPRIAAAAPSSAAPDSWLKKIIAGLDASEFLLHYQPKRCAKTGKVVGAEGLLRWEKNGGKIKIFPTVFIEKAEESGAIHMLGEFVLEEACKTLGNWKNIPGLKDATLSINVSPTQLLDPDFSLRLKQKMKQHKVPKGRLELEITEDVLISDKRTAARHIKELSDCLFSIDDFGKGSTEFQYLADFRIDTIKIDRSLLLDALHFLPEPIQDKNGRATEEVTENTYKRLIDGIVGLAKGVRAKVVVEGVENQKALELIRESEIPVFQGYYQKCQPMSIKAFESRFSAMVSFETVESQIATPNP